MKRIAIGIALLITTSSLPAQQSATALFPSVYYTEGSYSNGTQATSYAGYASISRNAFDYLVTGYEMISIESSTGTYDQRMFVIGGLKNLYPFYLKLNYAGVKGTFRESGTQVTSVDGIDIVNAGLQYNLDLIILGLTYTYENVSGYKDVRCHQVGLTGIWLIDPAFSVSVSPLYTTLTDGRSLKSVSAGISLSPWQPLVVQAFGALGKRAYHFNPENLTVFNQDETQKNLWGVRGDLSIGGGVTIVGSYQLTSFVGYSIEYLTIGARARLEL
jgi:hypothetical protein